MRMSLKNAPTPVLAGVVREAKTRSVIAAIKNAQYAGAGCIDLHLSCLEDKSFKNIKDIIGCSPIPVLALHYSFDECGKLYRIEEEERIECLLTAVEAGAAAIDIQGYTFHIESKDGFCGEDKYSFTKNNPKEIVTDSETIKRQCELIDKVHDMGAEVLLSNHPGVYMDSNQLTELALFLEERKPDIIKLVTPCETDEQLAECFKAMLSLKNNVKTPVSYHCSGKHGMISRAINPCLGGFMAFCSPGFLETAAWEQPDLKTMRTIVDNMRCLR